MILALGVAAQQADHAGVVGGVDLFGARRGAEKAGDAAQSVFVGLPGKGAVLGMGIRLALEGGQQVLDSDNILGCDCRHGDILQCSVVEATVAGRSPL